MRGLYAIVDVTREHLENSHPRRPPDVCEDAPPPLATGASAPGLPLRGAP